MIVTFGRDVEVATFLRVLAYDFAYFDKSTTMLSWQSLRNYGKQ